MCIRDRLSSMQEAGVSYKTLFLDAADDKLIARYKSSRRRHPLCTDGTTIWQGIQRERLMLMGLRDRADYVIDTTDMLPQKLRSTIRGLFATAVSYTHLDVYKRQPFRFTAGSAWRRADRYRARESRGSPVASKSRLER